MSLYARVRRVTPLMYVSMLAACMRDSAVTPRADTTNAPLASRSAPRVDSSNSGAATVATSAPITVTPFGIGPVRAGMSLDAVAAALDGALVVPTGTDTASCGYVQWRGGPAGVRIMTEHGTVARIDVDSDSIATDAGARIGDTEQRVEHLYAPRVSVSPSKYTPGHYLTVTPAAIADSAYRIVFETEHGRVTRYRAGRRPAVEYVEGCG